MKISERILELSSWAKQDLLRLVAQLEGHEADETEPLADPADTAPGFEHVPDHVEAVAAVDSVSVPVLIDGMQAEGTGENAPPAEALDHANIPQEDRHDAEFADLMAEVNGKK